MRWSVIAACFLIGCASGGVGPDDPMGDPDSDTSIDPDPDPDSDPDEENDDDPGATDDDPCVITIDLNNGGQRILEHDERGLLIQDASHYDSGSIVSKYTWNAAGDESTETTPTGGTVIRTYADLGYGRRIQSVDSSTRELVFEYSPSGELEAATEYGSSGSTLATRIYDSQNGRILQVDVHATPYDSRYTFEYDANERLERKVFYHNGSFDPSLAIIFSRDADGRVVSIASDGGANGSIDSEDLLSYEGDCEAAIESWWLTGEPGAES